MSQEVKTNSIKAWLLAARPKTLTAAAVPVMMGVAFAFRETLQYKDTWYVMPPTGFIYTGMPEEKYYIDGVFRWIPAILCLLFAWVMQIDSNFVNDYFDCKHGNDGATRLGPKRACAEGWVTMKAMKWAIGITTAIGCLIGLPLIYFGGMEMVLVGIACVAFCFLYTTTLSYLGLGDVLVLMFFGIVPVCCTYYVCMPVPLQMPTSEVFMSSIACGLAVDNLLMVNNFRDRKNDRENGKMTLVVKLGYRNAKWLALHLGCFAFAIMAVINVTDLIEKACILPISLIYVIYIYLHLKTYHSMVFIDKRNDIDKAQEYNKVLGATARNIFIFGLLSVIGILSYLWMPTQL